ncbi:MAG: MSMEG_0568 family radical SAM protein [Candidatus Atabeyarchaeum deiterrae]
MTMDEGNRASGPGSLFELKVKLLCEGIRVPEGIAKGRKAGAGPAGGLYLQLGDHIGVNAATWPKFAQQSSLSLLNLGGDSWIVRDGDLEYKVRPLQRPKYYDLLTRDGIPMSKIALSHSVDCIATTILQACVYWRSGEQCRFCGIELSLRDNDTVGRKTPRQLIEVIDEAIAERVCSHVTLTTGTPPAEDKGIKNYVGIVEALKAIHPSLPMQVQFEPPKTMITMDELSRAGVESVGIHVESFDQAVFKRICPGKSRTAMEEYFEAWRFAVELFGEGQVSTYVIAGLGESDDNIVPAARLLANLGVIPYLVPFRPITGTTMENMKPPSTERMIRLYTEVADVLNEFGLHPGISKAGCPRCGGCSALEEAMKVN